MKKEDVKELRHGLYRIYWKKKEGGGTSVASVGNLHDGQKWIAPTNWTAKVGENPTAFGKIWDKVKKVELICIE